MKHSFLIKKGGGKIADEMEFIESLKEIKEPICVFLDSIGDGDTLLTVRTLKAHTHMSKDYNHTFTGILTSEISEGTRCALKGLKQMSLQNIILISTNEGNDEDMFNFKKSLMGADRILYSFPYPEDILLKIKSINVSDIERKYNE